MRDRRKPDHLLKRARRLYPLSLLLTLSADEKFDLYWVPEPNSGCFLWFGRTQHDGYGQFIVGPAGKQKHWMTHRYAYQRARGKIPPGHDVDHKCRVIQCVNPDHLRLLPSAIHVRVRRSRRASPEIVAEIRRLRGEGMTLADIGDRFGLSPNYVCRLAIHGPRGIEI